MGELKERLRTDMTAAMKARETVRVSTLRMVLTAITNAEVAGDQANELTDAQIVDVLNSEAKKRRESAEAYREAGRDEAASKERAEAEIIAEYLPAQLTEAELEQIVSDAVAEAGASGPKDMGAVMKLVQPRTKSRADGATVAAKVKAALSS